MTWEPHSEWETRFAWLPIMTVGGRMVWLRRYETRQLAWLYNDGHDHRRERRTSAQNRLMPQEASMWRPVDHAG